MLDVLFCLFNRKPAYERRISYWSSDVCSSDLVCYRRHGHNEADGPSATQPIMYGRIRNHKTTRQLYAERLVEGGVIDAAGAEGMQDDYRDRLDHGDRQSDGAGMGVAGRVSCGGRRTHKKTKK